MGHGEVLTVGGVEAVIAALLDGAHPDGIVPCAREVNVRSRHGARLDIAPRGPRLPEVQREDVLEELDRIAEPIVARTGIRTLEVLVVALLDSSLVAEADILPVDAAVAATGVFALVMQAVVEWEADELSCTQLI